MILDPRCCLSIQSFRGILGVLSFSRMALPFSRRVIFNVYEIFLDEAGAFRYFDLRKDDTYLGA